jgi:hypothetical protein
MLSGNNMTKAGDDNAVGYDGCRQTAARLASVERKGGTNWLNDTIFALISSLKCARKAMILAKKTDLTKFEKLNIIIKLELNCN